MEVKLSVVKEWTMPNVVVQPKTISFCKMYICKCTVTVSSVIFIAFDDEINTDVYFKNDLSFSKFDPLI